MKYAEFAVIVTELTERAERDPRRYRMRVAGFALLGYAYLFAVVIGLLLLVPVAIWIALAGSAFAGAKLIAVLLVPIGAILKSLWVRIPPPQGGAGLGERDAPELFDMIEALRSDLGAPRVHHVLVTPELNAAIVQAPRLGVLGWYRNYLIVGLPLLQALTPSEFRAVLGHELGHLSGRHGRFGAWIYRKRRTWAQLAQAFTADNFLVGRFLSWYVPQFNANTFVLARQHEYEADRAAATVAGTDATRNALMRIEIASRYVQERFWPELEEGARTSRDPPRDAFRRLRNSLGEGPPSDDADVWLAEALKRPTAYADTHPTLADRLRALGNDADAGETTRPPPALDGRTAATEYLGELEDRIELNFDQLWVSRVQQNWKARHEELTASHARLEELEAPQRELSGEERWERVCLANDLGKRDEAFRLAEALAQDQPEHAGAQLFMGRSLLEKGDPTGVPYVERAIELDEGAGLFARKLLYEFHWGRGEREEAERHLTDYESRSAEARAAQLERQRVDTGIKLRPHGLPEETVAKLRDALLDYRQIKRAYLCRRLVEHRPEDRIYVVGIKPRGFQFGFDAQSLLQRVLSEVNAGPNVYFIVLAHDMRWLGRRMKKVAGSRLF